MAGLRCDSQQVVETKLEGSLMWSPTTRAQHNRDHLRYASDVTDAEWRLLAPHLSPPCRTGGGVRRCAMPLGRPIVRLRGRMDHLDLTSRPAAIN